MNNKRKKRKGRAVVLVVAGVLVCWVGGDFAYSRITSARAEHWEAGIERDADGVRTGCREFTIGEGDTAILMVHGFADSPAVWRKMATVLADEGFACRAMRLPGFAMPMSEYRTSTREQWLRAVSEELAALRATHPRVLMIAHSLGGAIAVNHLLDEPEAVDDVVLLAPLIGVANRRSPVLSAETWHNVGERILLITDILANVFPVDCHDPAAAAAMKRDVYIPRNIHSHMFATIRHNRRRMAEFRTPLMLVLSRADKVVDHEQGELFYERCASADKEIHYAPDAGHMIMEDYGWEAITELILKRFRRVTEDAGGGVVQ